MQSKVTYRSITWWTLCAQKSQAVLAQLIQFRSLASPLLVHLPAKICKLTVLSIWHSCATTKLYTGRLRVNGDIWIDQCDSDQITDLKSSIQLRCAAIHLAYMDIMRNLQYDFASSHNAQVAWGNLPRPGKGTYRVYNTHNRIVL